MSDAAVDNSYSSVNSSLSLDERIRLARQKAESFATSLNETRQREFNSLKSLEHERKHWAEALAVRTVELEQVERELELAVTTLQRNRIDDNGQDTLNGIDVLQKPQLSEGIIDNQLSKVSIDDQIVNRERETIFSRLQRSQNDNKKLQLELINRRSDYDKVVKDLNELKMNYESLQDRNLSLLESLSESEKKLEYRLQQVVHLDEEKERLKANENALLQRLNSLESQLFQQKSETSTVSSELRSSMHRVQQLEYELSNRKDQEIIIAQNDKIRSLEDLASKLNARMESLEASHKQEIERLENRYMETSKLLIDEQNVRNAVQKQNESLSFYNRELANEKSNLSETVMSLEDRINELQRVIPRLVSNGRDDSVRKSNNNDDENGFKSPAKDISDDKRLKSATLSPESVSSYSVQSGRVNSVGDRQGVSRSFESMLKPQMFPEPPKTEDFVDNNISSIGGFSARGESLLDDVPPRKIINDQDFSQFRSTTYDDFESSNRKAYLLRLQEAQKDAEKSLNDTLMKAMMLSRSLQEISNSSIVSANKKRHATSKSQIESENPKSLQHRHKPLKTSVSSDSQPMTDKKSGKRKDSNSSQANVPTTGNRISTVKGRSIPPSPVTIHTGPSFHHQTQTESSAKKTIIMKIPQVTDDFDYHPPEMLNVSLSHMQIPNGRSQSPAMTKKNISKSGNAVKDGRPTSTAVRKRSKGLQKQEN